MTVYNVTPGYSPYNVPATSLSRQQSSNQQQATSNQQATSQNVSSSYIPEYSQTPILESIAKYSAGMAPQVYQWGMDQFSKNQGNIDALMRNALSYASPQRIAANMGMAEAGVQQGAEAGRQSAIRDLQGYGIDPSAGRYAGLDTVNRVMAGATTAGAGNQQRMSDIAQGNAMQNQAISSSLQNVGQGVATANAADAFAKTGMSLPYSPLGTVSIGGSQSTGSSQSSGSGQSAGISGSLGAGNINSNLGAGVSLLGSQHLAEGGDVIGDVGYERSPSRGQAVDDVPAQLTAGEFVIPKDVAAWKGQEFFYKLMAQARKLRATAGDDSPAVGYGAA